MVQVKYDRKGAYEVVYNLSAFAEGFFLPAAYIVSLDNEGFLAHIQQKAIAETIGSFGLNLDPVRERLFQLIDELQPKALEQQFNPSRKRPKPLETLLENRDLNKQINQYVHERLDELLTAVERHRLPLTWNVERKILVKDFLLEISGRSLQPELYFNRTGKGVTYRLKLNDNDHVWKISSREIIPITNYPAWLFVDYRLYKVAHINGNMVKPFSNRDEVHIPEASVKTYFQKFILKVAAQVDINARGFDVVQYDTLQACIVEALPDLYSGRWVLQLKMAYPKASFYWHDKKDKRTTLELQNDDFRIVQVRRDLEAEQRLLHQFRRLDIEPFQDNQFLPRNVSDDELSAIEWLANNRADLEAAGFQVGAPEHNQQAIYLYEPTVDLKTEQYNDWFDIFGQVQVGVFSFPFLDLAKNIREGNRFYTLPDGKLFLIPQEWMNQFGPLFQFAKKDGEQLRLNKNQFALLEELGIQEDTGVEISLDEIDFAPSPKLKATLRPYQLDGAKWLVQLYRNHLGGCLADDMGLGKTLQTITVLLHAKEEKAKQLAGVTNDQHAQMSLFEADQEDLLAPLNALIILPASLVFNWAREFKKFAPHLTICRHVGQRRQKNEKILSRYDVILTTYQTALRDVHVLENIEHEYIVLDESQQIKNRESKIFKAINRLQGKHKISLSGTPIENSLSDLWSQMQFINPDLLGTYSFFKREFITPIEKHADEEKKNRLRALVAPYLLRRTKEEVARDLPPLTTKIFYSEMTPEQKKLYEKEKSAARNFLLENFDANNPQYRIIVLQSLTKLRQIVNHPRIVFPDYEKDSGKYNDILEHWDVIQRSNHKALFFSSFVQYLNLFQGHFKTKDIPYARLTGELSSQERENQIRFFEENPDVQSFLISIKSGGSGLNLTAADYVFLLDPWWNPTTEQQAIARAHRIGQDKNVIAVKFITKDSIEEKILRLQRRKTKLAEDILDNVRRADFSRGDIEYLLG